MKDLNINTCPCSGYNLSKFVQPSILLILNRQPLTRYNIIKELPSIPFFKKSIPDVAGIYRSINLLENNELIICLDNCKNNSKYHITTKGKYCLEKWKKTLITYNEEIRDFLKMLEYT